MSIDITDKTFPLNHTALSDIVANHPTPFYLYDERAIIQNAERLKAAFSWVTAADGTKGGYQNYFAVKALPNPHILSLLKKTGMGVDCSSMAELVLAERCGFKGGDIFFTSNNTPIEEFQAAAKLQGYINLDDIAHLAYLKEHDLIPPFISFRYNPGSKRSGNSIIGNPEEAKFGATYEQLLTAYPQAREYGVKRFGLHTMVISNELDTEYFIQTAKMLFEIAITLYEQQGIRIECINIGGGMGVAYRPTEQPVDYQRISAGIHKLYEEKIVKHNLHPIRIVSENGRVITGPYGYLVSRVRHLKHTYKQFVGLDATMANLMRPGMYGAYHHITVASKEHAPHDHLYDITGSLCENNDKFAIDRQLPHIEVGDIVVIHDAGAHGHAMGFNYNGKLRCAELLLKEDESVLRIRRAETLENYFTTLDFLP